MRRLGEWIGLTILGCALTSASCKGRTDNQEGTSGAPAGSSPMGASALAAPASSGPVGVADCDAYIAKVTACFARDPDLKTAREANFLRLQAGWKRALQNNRAAVEFSCKKALSDVGATMPTCK